MTDSDADRPVPGSIEFEPGSRASGGLRKTRVPGPLRLDDLIATGRPVPVVVEVAEPGYRPAELQVRAEITDRFLTGTVPPTALADLDRDPGVVAVEISRPLGVIE